jgi:hypothetical protein
MKRCGDNGRARSFGAGGDGAISAIPELIVRGRLAVPTPRRNDRRPD